MDNQALMGSSVHPYVFADREGKFWNLIIVSLTNCDKILLLCTLEMIFKRFLNPAYNKYGWVDAPKIEAIFVNNFCWSSNLIKWNYFLLLLEGYAVHLPTPKNHFASDTCIHKHTPLSVTKIGSLWFYKNNCLWQAKICDTLQ